jgi:hypothetical protein
MSAYGRAVQMLLIETYAQHDTAVAALADSGRRAAHHMAGRGYDVRYVQTIFVADDETCFYLFEAASAETLAAGTRGTELASGRITAVAANLAAP